MGFSPVEVDQMDMWQFQAASDGWEAAHNPNQKEALPQLSDDEMRAFLKH